MEGLTWNSTLIRGQKQEKKSVNEECRAGLVVRDLKEEESTGWKGRGGGYRDANVWKWKQNPGGGQVRRHCEHVGLMKRWTRNSKVVHCVWKETRTPSREAITAGQGRNSVSRQRRHQENTSPAKNWIYGFLLPNSSYRPHSRQN